MSKVVDLVDENGMLDQINEEELEMDMEEQN